MQVFEAQMENIRVLFRMLAVIFRITRSARPGLPLVDTTYSRGTTLE